MIYVPDIQNFTCYCVYSEDIIRAYETIPEQNLTVRYRDYFINSNYIYRDGYQQFSMYSTIPQCLDNSILTDSVYYRLDFDRILVILLILSIFIVYVPLKVVMRFFRRFQ